MGISALKLVLHPGMAASLFASRHFAFRISPRISPFLPHTLPVMENSPQRERRKRPRRTETPILLRGLNYLQAAGILAMVVASPWLFGTTEAWSIQLMNWITYSLGGILLLKKVTCFLYRDQLPTNDIPPKPRLLTLSLDLLICFLLGYILLSALNARAAYNFDEQQFLYRDDYNPKLPHSYDSNATWRDFWQYLGFACFFWTLRNWLLTDPGTEQNQESSSRRFLSPRLKLLLWIICLNGSLVALQAILQRLSGSSKLLWIRESWWKRADACFGPYSYRSNAAQYLNLIWPVTVGLWLTLRSEFKRRNPTGRGGEGPHLVLIPLAAVTALAPLVSLSRGGAVIAGALLLAILATILFSTRFSLRFRLGTAAVFAVVVVLGANLAWPQLKKRLASLEHDQLGGRQEIYDNARKIASDFPRFGTGAGSFPAVYQLYRSSATQIWQAYVHDDWLEARATLGWVGFSVVLGLLLLGLSAVMLGGGLPLPPLLVTTMLLGLAGCLLHARFDFPLQIYSILLLVLTFLGILSSGRIRK